MPLESELRCIMARMRCSIGEKSAVRSCADICSHTSVRASDVSGKASADNSAARNCDTGMSLQWVKRMRNHDSKKKKKKKSKLCRRNNVQ